MEENNKEISKIKIEDQTYNIKDLEVRKKLKELLGDDYYKEEEENTSSDN